MMTKKNIKLFSSPKALTIFNAIILVIALTGNFFLQVFCVPVRWAVIVLILCFLSTVLTPMFIKNDRLLPLIAFLNGISLMVFVYCIIFLEHMNTMGLFAIFFFGIGLLACIPHFFALQLLWLNLIKPKNKLTRLYFVLGIIVSLSVAIYAGNEYKKAVHSIEDFKRSAFTQLDRTYMNEKILGMHFIYHIRFCEYDGWRPPKHDPFLVVGMWLNNRVDPLDLALEKRIELYKKFFPERKIKFNCSCAWTYSSSYHRSEILK